LATAIFVLFKLIVGPALAYMAVRLVSATNLLTEQPIGPD
jgi:hypothetical protein